MSLTMQLILPLVVLGLIVAISIFGGGKKSTSDKKTAMSNTLTPTQEISVTPSPSTIQQKTLGAETSPTSTVKITINQSNSTPTTQTNTNTSDWRYPEAQDNGNSSFTSSQNPTTITNWYKDKIKSLGMNTTSFVTTNTNDNVLNKLAGANGSENVTIEIKKDSSESTTHITISH